MQAASTPSAKASMLQRLTPLNKVTNMCCHSLQPFRAHMHKPAAVAGGFRRLPPQRERDHAAHGGRLTHMSLLQSLVDAGGFHPSVNATMLQRLSVSYTPGNYPPPYLQAQGYKCSCGQFFENTCRAAFRNVRRQKV